MGAVEAGDDDCVQGREQDVGAVEGDDDRDVGREREQWKQVMTIAYQEGGRE